MADYHAILKRAIGALPEPTGEARRAVYEKARTALVNQLKSFDPPLSASEITQQRLQLEDAIRRVEGEAAKSILSQALARPTGNTAPPPAAPASAKADAAATPVPPASVPPASPAPAAASPPAPVVERPRATAPTAWPKSPPKPPEASATDAGKPAPVVERKPTAPPARTPPAAPPPQAPTAAPPPSMDALRQAVDEVDRLGAATAATARQAREVLAPAVGATVEDAGAPEAPARDRKPTRKEKAASRRAEKAEPSVLPDEPRPSRWPLAIGLAAAGLVLAVGVTALWTKRDELAAYFGASPNALGGIARAGNEKTLAPKVTDRLLPEPLPGTKPQSSANPGSGKVVSTQPIVTSPSVQPAPGQTPSQVATIAPPPSSGTPALPSGMPALPPGPPALPPGPAAGAPTATQPALPTPALPPVAGDAGQSVAAATPAQPAADQPPTPAGPVPPVAQKASLLEEGPPNTAQSSVSPGTVVWQTVREPPQPGKAPVMLVRARVEIPERKLALTLTIQPNTDQSFPASHLIELRFEVPPDFDRKGVANVPGLIMKTTEQVRGDPLVGAAARISSGFFWIALSSPDADRARNLNLLKERGWIDIPILYDDGRRAILILEKAGAGDRVIADAVAAWQQGG
ncbi:hypothetical protein [Prosthecomicrobium sp. N25]|uniref:hypothetical protein n=1 Tax=Prosthecomicrobium sp. N25 TaxID=3129254 RepID=UPI0030777AE4